MFVFYSKQGCESKSTPQFYDMNYMSQMMSFLKHRLGYGLLKNKIWKMIHEVDICAWEVLAAAIS